MILFCVVRVLVTAPFCFMPCIAKIRVNANIFRAETCSTSSTYSTMLIIKKLYCSNTATTTLQYSTKFTTSISFLQNDCFFYSVEILNMIYIVVYQYGISAVERVESVEVLVYL